MKELNDLVKMARCPQADDWSGQIVSPETILDIAEAFRALERDNQMILAGADWMDFMAETTRKALERAEAAEAKLAEYEKQEPFGFCNEDAKNSDVFSATVWREREDAESRSCGLELFPLFTRPAPATSPEELVPDCLVDAMCNLDLAGVSIGDKAIIGKAIEVLQNIEQQNER